MAYMQMHKPTDGKTCGKQDNHGMMTCQTTCQETTSTGGETQVHGHGHACATHGLNGGATHGYISHGPSPKHGYNSHGAGQVHGYNSRSTSQVHGYSKGGQFHGATGGACYGKQKGGMTVKVKNMFGKRKQKTRIVNGGNTSCSNSDGESDDECRRR